MNRTAIAQRVLPDQAYDFKYSWTRTRQIEETFNGSESEGVWPINYHRVLRGWGQIQAGDYWQDYPNWPPPDPSNFDEEASRGRIYLYTRVWNADDCFRAFERGSRVSAAFRVTSRWKNPDEGRLDFCQAGDPVLGGHSLGLQPPAFFTPSPLQWSGKDYFVSPNSWGERWGNRGWAAMTKDFFDREMYEAWSIEKQAEAPELFGTGVQHIKRWVGEFIDRRFFLYEIVDTDHNDRLAWSIVVHCRGELQVEDLYVKPSARGRGYGAAMIDYLAKMSEEFRQPLRFWIPFADVASPSNFEHVRTLFAEFQLRIDVSPMPWAAYCATSGVPLEQVPHIELPPKAAFTFSTAPQTKVNWDKITKDHLVDEEFLKHAQNSLKRHEELLRRLA